MPSLFDNSQRSHNVAPQDDPRLLSAAIWAEARIFLAVAKAKSYQRAAQSLNISRNTVTSAVLRLEDVMNAQLLVKSTSGVNLTPKGEDLADRLLGVDQALFAMQSDLQAETKETEGTVRVTCTEALTGLFIVPALKSFNAIYPRVHLHTRNPINLLSFRENLSDIMVGFGPLNQPGLVSKPSGYLHLIAIVAHSYAEQHGVPTRANLAAHHFIDAEYYASNTPAYSSWRSAVALGTVAHQIDNPFAYAMMVKAGGGIGLLSNFTLADRDVFPVDIGSHVRLPIFIHALEDRLQSKPVRVVYDWLAELFSPANPWFSDELRTDAYPPRIAEDAFERITVGTRLAHPASQ